MVSSVQNSIPLGRETGEGSTKYLPTEDCPKSELNFVKFLLGSSLSAMCSPSCDFDSTPCLWIMMTQVENYQTGTSNWNGNPSNSTKTVVFRIHSEMTSLREQTSDNIDHIQMLQAQMNHVLSSIHRPMLKPGELESITVCRNIWLLLLDEIMKSVASTPCTSR